ncbi:glycosyltransferase family 4 protein [Vibrio sp. B181a]|uniref:glycosyltransferase family 4 protein n=1 Tax=Vibrio sp. B181a TaxID=2835906 RepID=UPI002553CFD8|nr:glycosyltransferase family 4 protein [Vibrio sp. B181a]MDK9773410.1 glycosyltransferase family 4 protein [Vibrio sp. B181a]
MKLYLLINDLAKVGGLRTVSINLSKALIEKGYDVSIISAVDHQPRCSDVKVATFGLPKLHGLSKLEKLFWYIRCFFKFNRFSKGRNNDIFIGIGTIMNLMMFSKSSQVIATEHTAYKNNSPIVQWIRKLAYSRYKKIVLLTQRDKHYYEKLNSHLAVIPNFIDDVRMVDYCLDSHRVLFVGMLSKVKGSDYLLEIIKKSVSRNANIHFDIVGDGPDLAAFSEAIESLSIGSRVTVHGRLNNVTGLYQNAGVFILTSRNEGFPMVLLEAQSHGLPVVSFDCETGPSEMIQHGYNGYLVDTFDTEAFSEHLVDLFEDRSLRNVMSKNSSRNVKKFTKNEVIRLWDEVLKQ